MNQSTTVLLVEAAESDATIVKLLLDHSGFNVDHVPTMRDAIGALHDRGVDIILLDNALHVAENGNAIQRLRMSAPDTPIVLLAAEADEQQALDAIKEGAQEFLSKEHMIGQLLTRTIRHSIARHRQLQTALDDALTDALTGVGNRRAFNRELDQRSRQVRQPGMHQFVALYDIDHFKSVNDQYGHDIGDLVLGKVAKILKSTKLESDIVTRFGGEEFGVLMCRESSQATVSIIRESQRRIENEIWNLVGLPVPLTISCGFAELLGRDDGEAALRRADEALYGAKRHGRNCCFLHDGRQIGLVVCEYTPS